MSRFSHAPVYPPDQIFGLSTAFQLDERPEKIDLSVGVYRNEKLEAEILPVVKIAEERMIGEEKEKSYLRIDGEPTFNDLAKELLFADCIPHENIYAAQTVGGTSALHLGGEFLFQLDYSQIALPTPTWANHQGIFLNTDLHIEQFPYYDKTNNELMFDDMLDALKHLAENTAVMLHGSCHNPTGCDPTLEQWKEISEVMKKKKLIPFFDVAYQGLGRSLDEDAEAARFFAKEGHEMLVAFSFSKSFGLYGERTGVFFAVTESEKAAGHIASMTKRHIRSNYSNPPRHGALIVRTILQNEELKKMWIDQLGAMQVRLSEMRNLLADKLTEKLGTDYSFMKKRYGLFSYTGLREESVKKLIDEHAIYMPNSGRINITGLNQNNIDIVAEAIKEVM